MHPVPQVSTGIDTRRPGKGNRLTPKNVKRYIRRTTAHQCFLRHSQLYGHGGHASRASTRVLLLQNDIKYLIVAWRMAWRTFNVRACHPQTRARGGDYAETTPTKDSTQASGWGLSWRLRSDLVGRSPTFTGTPPN